MTEAPCCCANGLLAVPSVSIGGSRLRTELTEGYPQVPRQLDGVLTFSDHPKSVVTLYASWATLGRPGSHGKPCALHVHLLTGSPGHRPL